MVVHYSDGQTINQRKEAGVLLWDTRPGVKGTASVASHHAA